MKLIREQIEEIQYIFEEDKTTGKKNLFIEGIFCQAEKQNKNGRVYPFNILNREVERYNKEYVSQGRAVGELGHPDSPQINLDRISHKITTLKPQGNDFVGKAQILDTPMGNITRGLIDGGVKLGVSTRGVGSLKPHNGYQLVQDDFKLATAADIVHDPSAPMAWVKGIMENYDWWMDNSGNWQKRHIEEVRHQVRKFSKREIEQKALSLFEAHIRKL